MSISSVSQAGSEAVPMKDDYNCCSKGQRQVLELAKPFIEKGVDAHSARLIGTDDCVAPMILADFGASTGTNSSAAISFVIRLLRAKYGYDKTPSIIVLHEDIPRNNWCELFNFIYTNRQSYMSEHKGVFGVGCGRSFYQQVLPDKSLHFGISNVALHWTSQSPTKIKHHCLPAKGSPEERKLFKKQADDDWIQFITARSAELVSGGVLVLNIIYEDDSILTMYDALYAAAKRLMYDGYITDQELLNFNVNVVFRSLADVTDPDLLEKLGLENIAAENREPQSNVFYKEYKVRKSASTERLEQAHKNQQGKDGSHIASILEGYRVENEYFDFVEDYSTILSSSCEPSFMEALSPRRTYDERQAISNTLWRTYKDVLRNTYRAEQLSKTWGNDFVVFRKK